ncbi:MarR family winged helix-turn-helix transcriptional regulator [Tardiphaga sp. 866_E4_N2_1]|uniref:MarR family winged helix-turn-helix transcriptional regulator n=1 Tax=unclassified Tardiphaga TaxID=2631404 RepID=UPI003F25E9D3
MTKTKKLGTPDLGGMPRKKPPTDQPAHMGGAGKNKHMTGEGVAAIISRWEQERPDLDFRPMSLFVALTRSHDLASSQIDRLAERFGLTRGMLDVLATLRRSGPPYSLTPKQLSASLLLSGAGMTSRCDSLEKLNLVVRTPEPSDRRSLQIKMTRRGISMVDRILPELLETQRSLFDFGESNARQLLTQLKAMNEHLTELIEAARDT